MSKLDLIQESKEFPNHCKLMIRLKAGDKFDNYFEYLDWFVGDVISQFELVFEKRKNEVRLACESERDDKTSKNELMMIQIAQYEPSKLIKDIQEIINSLQGYLTYRQLSKPFTHDEYIAKFYKRYELSEPVYTGLISASTRSIGELRNSIEGHLESSRNLATVIGSINKSSGLKKVVAIGASMVGGFLGATVAHSVGVRAGGGRIGAAGASALVAGLFGDTKKLKAAVAAYENSFNKIHGKWLETKSKLQEEVEIVVYSIFGGALLRLVDDFRSASIVVRLEQSGLMRESLIARAMLTTEKELGFKKWADDALNNLIKLHENGQFAEVNILSKQALQFTLQFEPRIKIRNHDGSSYSIEFQRLYLQSFVALIRSVSIASEINRLWNELLPNLAVLPDQNEDSELISVAIELDRLLKSTDKKNIYLSTGIFIQLYRFYNVRRKYYLGDPFECWAYPGENFSLISLYLLRGIINGHSKIRNSTQDVRFDDVVENAFSKNNPIWNLKCIRQLKKNGARWSDSLYEKLIKRLALQCLFALLILGGVSALLINYESLM